MKRHPAVSVALLLFVTVATHGTTAIPGTPAAPPLKERETIELGGGVAMEFVLIRPGAFVMGTDTHEYDEGPAHAVTIMRPFYLGKYEVTQAQWERVTGANPSHFKGARRPVDNVSWDDCQRFLAALQKIGGRKFALPTEAQWEYACRAGSTTEFSFGDDEAALGAHAWFASNSELTTHAVGEKTPNAWGLHDMHGNVYEWCADWYSEGPYPGGAAVDPRGAAGGRRRVLRGGGWLFVSDNLRSADRAFSPPDYRSNEYGFRCVLRIDGGEEPPGSAPAAGAVQPTPAIAPADDAVPAPDALPERLVVTLAKGVTMELVLIRPGAFTMGSESSPLLNEKPTHRVTITRPFYLGKFEVTQRQWEVLMEQNRSSFRDEPGTDGAANLPVDGVNWPLCQAFCAKLTAVVPGFEFRLPTEAEWEYACRAGTEGERHFARGELDDYAWHGGNAGGRTHAVGSRKPNAWGLHDMYGNVWEWCADRYGPYSAEAVADPTGPGVSFSGARVLRGGAWNNLAAHVNSTFRHDVAPGMLMKYYGFRCAASPKAAPRKEAP